MKLLKIKFPKVAIVLFLITVVLNSCSGDDDATSSGQDDYSLIVKIDGVVFSANSENSNVSALADLTPIYTIIGIDDDGGRITLMLESPIAIGTYSASTNNSGLGSDAVLSYVSPDNEIFSISDGTGPLGTITITNNNENFVEGTFSFTGESQQSDDIKVFTEGEFKAKKQ